MTVLGDFSDDLSPDTLSAGAPTDAMQSTAAKGTLPGFYGAAQTLGGDVLGGAVNMVDNLASNKLLPSAIRAQKGAVNNAALGAVGMPGLNDFYNANRDGIELATGVGGLVASEVVARKLTAPMGAFMGAMRAVPYVRTLATLDEKYQGAMDVVRNVDSALAARGAIGAEQYVGEASAAAPNLLNFDSKTAGLGQDVTQISRNKAVFQAKALGAASHAASAAFTEGLTALAFNSNSFLYSDSASQNMMWQAMGIAGGAASGWYQGAYQIRKFVNDDTVKRAFATAYDPQGIEESRLLWANNPTKATEMGPYAGFRGGAITDKITNLLVNAATNEVAPTLGENGINSTLDAAALKTNRGRLATQQKTQARDMTQMITTKGIPTDGYTRFSMDAPGYGNHVDELLNQDPAGLLGVEQMGGIPDNTTAWQTHINNQNRLNERIQQTQEQLQDPTISTTQANNLTDLARRLASEQTLTPAAIIDAERVPISEAKSIEQYVEPQVRFTPEAPSIQIGGPKKSNATGIWQAQVPGSESAPITVDSNFIPHFPGGKTIDTADHFSVLHAYRAADQAIAAVARDPNHVLQVAADAPWFQLDAVEEALRRSDGQVKVQWPQGMTRDSAQVESFAQKADAREAQINRIQAGVVQATGQPADPADYASRLRVRYNLPRQTAYEMGVTGITENPVESLMKGVTAAGSDNIRDMSLDDIKQSVANVKNIGDVAPYSASDVQSLYGNSFRYMLDSKGRPMKPILTYARPFMPATWTNDAIAERMTQSKLLAVGKMTDKDAGPLTRNLATGLMQSPDLELASQPHTLMDNQIQGSTMGAAPQSFWGGLGKSVASFDWIARDNPTLLAAARLRDNISRVTLSSVRDIISGSMGDVLDRLASPRNASSQALMDQFHSFAGGWDIEDKVVPDSSGNFSGFTLSDTQKNRTRWTQQFDGDMPQGQPLVGPQGQKVMLDNLSLEAQTRFNKVTTAKLNEQNTILRANNLPEIQSSNWYVPPQDTRGRFLAFVVGPDGKTVPGMSINAATPEDFARQKAKLMPILDGKGLGYDLRTQDDIGNFANIWDKAQMDWIHPGTTAAMSGKESRGVLTGQEVRPGAFKQSMTTTRDQFIRHADDVTSTLLKEQINSAKARSVISTNSTANVSNQFAANAKKTKSIYDMYIEALTGKSALSAQNSTVGRIWNTAEVTVDGALAGSTPTASGLWHAVQSYTDRVNPWAAGKQATKTFDGLSAALGPYMPYQSAAEMLAAKTGAAVPWTSKLMASKMNSFAASALLRFGEVAHPIMNLAGVINAMPSVIMQMMPQGSEDAAAFAARVGHAATVFNLPDGRAVGALDMAKIGANSFKRAWAESSHPDFDYMIQHGYLKQEVAEFHKQFGSIDSQSGFDKFMNGDNQIKNPQGVAQTLASKGLIGWGSVLSDNSEDFSRSWAHMSGLEVADILGISDMSAKHNFAHDIANKMIANYSPANRPEIFQGALGSTIGLFQSFMQEYYQRMFRYVETGDHRALATQQAMQGSLFGIQTIPGWQQFQAMMNTTGGGENDPGSALREKFGAAGDLMMGGVLSNIPTLFGAPAVDLYSRGDTSIRLPGTSLPPAISIMAKISNGIGAGIQAFSQMNPGISHTQLAEIVSNMMPNRPMSGIIEQFGAHGNQTDKYGALVTDTQSAMEAAYRVIGLRSERQDTQLNAYYTNKTAMAHKASMDDVLRLQTRALMRQGDYDKIPQQFSTYVNNGGDPRQFQRWMRENYQAATTPKATQQLNAMYKNPKAMQEVHRLLAANVSIDDDAKTGDPTERYGPEESPVDDTSDQMTVPIQ